MPKHEALIWQFVGGFVAGAAFTFGQRYVETAVNARAAKRRLARWRQENECRRRKIAYDQYYREAEKRDAETSA